MNRLSLFAAALLAVALPAAAEQYATAKDAEVLVGKLAKAYAANKDETIKAINARDAKWVRPDLYPWILDSKGVALAHGANEKLVGKDLIDLQDIDGKQFVREYVQATMANGKSWTDFKYTDPVTKKVLPKSTYCEKSADAVVCAGIYKR